MSPPQLRILLISDFHESYDNIDKLAEYIRAHYIVYDTVIYLGDFLTLDNPSKAEEQQGLRDVEDILGLLSAKLNNGEKVLYVPGNHDPLALFSRAQAVTEHGVLLHNRLVKLCTKDESGCPPVVLHGFGGSSPGFQDGKVVWAGFPFETESDLAARFYAKRGTVEPVPECSVGKNLKAVPTGERGIGTEASIIFVTHQGPENSSTVIYTKEEVPIYSGSRTLFDAIKKNNNVVAHMHGHTHDAWGFCKIKQCTVVNPGSLKYGRCALVTLTLDGMRWNITETMLLSFS